MKDPIDPVRILMWLVLIVMLVIFWSYAISVAFVGR